MNRTIISAEPIESKGYDKDIPYLRWIRITTNFGEVRDIAIEFNIVDTPFVDTDTGCCFATLRELLFYVLGG